MTTVKSVIRIVFWSSLGIPLLLLVLLSIGWGMTYTSTRGVTFSSDGRNRTVLLFAQGNIAVENSRINSTRGSYTKGCRLVTSLPQDLKCEFAGRYMQTFECLHITVFTSKTANGPFMDQVAVLRTWLAEAGILFFGVIQWLIVSSFLRVTTPASAFSIIRATS